MDFDLFDKDEDDFHTTIALHLRQYDNGVAFEQELFPEFQCDGEDKNDVINSKYSFLNNYSFMNFATRNSTLLENIKFSKYEFRKKHLNESTVLNFMCAEVCMNIQYLVASVRSPTAGFGELSYYAHRRKVTEFYHLVSLKNDSIQCAKEIGIIRQLLNRITDEKTWKLIHLAHSNKGNECIAPAYHLLHGALEWKLLDLFWIHKYGSGLTWLSIEDKPHNLLYNQLLRIFNDLIYCSMLIYEKKKSTELLYQSAFPCICFKEFWIVLYVISPQWKLQRDVSDNQNNFWKIFDEAISHMKHNIDQFFQVPLKFCEFIIWLLAALTKLFSNCHEHELNCSNIINSNIQYSENTDLSDQCLKEFLNANPNEDQLRIIICILASTQRSSKNPRLTTSILLWEYFHKKLNTTFYMTSESPEQLAVVPNSGCAYVDKYRQLLSMNEVNISNTSYTQFVLLLGQILSGLIKNNQQHQAQKLLGRIYSKFSVQKFLALNESGIHHIIELFLILSLSGDFMELAPKLKDKLLTIRLDKITNSNQITVIKGHLAFLILHIEHQVPVNEYLQKLMKQLSNVRDNSPVLKLIADSLLDIFVRSSDLRNGEHILIDDWLPKYLSKCTQSEQQRTFEALHVIFVKLNSRGFVDRHEEILKSLHTHVLPFIKQQYTTNYNMYIPILASDFCICTYKIVDKVNFRQLFDFFIQNNSASRHSLPLFLTKILKSDKAALVDDTIIINIWLKSMIFATGDNEHVGELTNHVIQLRCFKYMTGLQPGDLLCAKEPLCTFISAIGKNYESCTDYQKRCEIADNFNTYLQNFEKWVHPDLKNEKSDAVFRFYSFIAIVIYNCPQLVYVKSKITCFFHISINKFILPTNIQMKKTPDTNLAILIHKIWPVLIQGIGKLNFKTDSYLNKTLCDLIEKWTPHFKISSNSTTVARPFITCILSDNNELSGFVLEKLTFLFLTTRCRQADPNACLILTIYDEILLAIKNSNSASTMSISTERLKTFMQSTCLQTLEHIMMVDEIIPSHSMALDLFKRLLCSEVYQSSETLQNIFKNYICSLTKKHLAYNTYFYFDLIIKLTEISFEPIEQLMDLLLNEICLVEQKRGAGKDCCIRGYLYKLKQAIEKSKCLR